MTARPVVCRRRASIESHEVGIRIVESNNGIRCRRSDRETPDWPGSDTRFRHGCRLNTPGHGVAGSGATLVATTRAEKCRMLRKTAVKSILPSLMMAVETN